MILEIFSYPVALKEALRVGGEFNIKLFDYF